MEEGDVWRNHSWQWFAGDVRHNQLWQTDARSLEEDSGAV